MSQWREAANTATTSKQAFGNFLAVLASAGAHLVLEDAGVERLEGVHQQVLHQQVDLVVYVLALRSHLPQDHTPCLGSTIHHHTGTPLCQPKGHQSWAWSLGMCLVSQ